MISSKRLRALNTIPSCPIVNGSKEPGKTAIFFIQIEFKLNINKLIIQAINELQWSIKIVFYLPSKLIINNYCNEKRKRLAQIEQGKKRYL
jgi:hypothetical protein